MWTKKINPMSYPREYNIIENKEITKVLKGNASSQEEKSQFITQYSLLFSPKGETVHDDNFDFYVKIKNLRYNTVNKIEGIEDSDSIDYTSPFELDVIKFINLHSLFKVQIDKNGRVVHLTGYSELLKKIGDEFSKKYKYSNIKKQLAPFEEAYFINLIEVVLSHLPICLDQKSIDLRFLSSCPMETGLIKRINTPYKIKEQDSQTAVIEASVAFNDEVEITPNLVLPLNVIYTGTLTFDFKSNQLINSLSSTTSQGEVNLDTSKISINVKNELFIEEVVKREEKVKDSVYSYKGFGTSNKEFRLSGREHKLDLVYEFFSEPDELVIYDQFNRELFNSGMKSTKQPISVSIPLRGVESLVFKINSRTSKSQWRYEFTLSAF
jgi:hypothetical protein